MPDFGYNTTTGWNPVTYQALLADFRAKYKAQSSANVDVLNGPAADMLDTLGLIFKDAWDGAQDAYNSGHSSAAPGTGGVAEGTALELLLTPRIGPKLAAVPSKVVLPLTGVAFTVIPAGQGVTIFGETITWTLDTEVELDGAGEGEGTFSYSLTGPKLVIATTTWAIANPVTGWATVGPNAEDGIPGRLDETDAEYRERYAEALLDNIIAAVRKVGGVTSASLIEWPSATPDAFWGLTHWVEVLVVGGADAEIARAITRTRAKGVRSVGNTTVVLADSDYAEGVVTEMFSRTVLVQCYVIVTISKGAEYPKDNSLEARTAREGVFRAAVRAHILALDPGQGTSGFKVAVAIHNAGVPGIYDVAVQVDIVDPPVNSGTLSMAVREQLTIALVDIEVNGA